MPITLIPQVPEKNYYYGREKVKTLSYEGFSYIKIKLFSSLILTVFLLSFIISPFLGGCQNNNGDGEEVLVRLRVTKDYGREIILSEELRAINNRSVLSLLQEHLAVELAYGNRFVNGIEGINSGYTGAGGRGEKMDWFFYANGILSGIGAADYYPLDGDYIWWDYHSWDDDLFIPAVTGAYPATFTNGYNKNQGGLIILYGENDLPYARKIESYLIDNGLDSLELSPYSEEKVTTRSQPTLVVAQWNFLRGDDFWYQFQENRSRTGWLVDLEYEGIVPLSIPGKNPLHSLNVQGAVLATGSGMGDKNPLWLITALSSENMKTLIELISDKEQSLSGSFAAVMIDNEIISLPLKSMQ